LIAGDEISWFFCSINYGAECINLSLLFPFPLLMLDFAQRYPFFFLWSEVNSPLLPTRVIVTAVFYCFRFRLRLVAFLFPSTDLWMRAFPFFFLSGGIHGFPFVLQALRNLRTFFRFFDFMF